MGFQDRDYNRYEPYDDHGYKPRRQKGPMSMTMRIVILNVVFWLVNGLLFTETNGFTELFVLHASALTRPAVWWEFLSYGFVHSPFSFWHIGGNMLALIMFGYGMMLGIGPGGFGLVRGENVEERLGRMEFLLFYLLTILVGGIAYAALNYGDPRAAALGASGGVTGVVILFALFFPNKVLLLMGILPMPMWAIGLLIVFSDAYGASGNGNQGIAYTIHLAGAGFALLYYFLLYQNRLRITDLFSVFKRTAPRKPKLKIYSDDPKQTGSGGKTSQEAEFEKKLDEILERYGKVGESGLTPEERDFLKRASRKYQNKRH